MGLRNVHEEGPRQVMLLALGNFPRVGMAQCEAGPAEYAEDGMAGSS